MIYLDHNATTRPSDGVVEAVTLALTTFWHNPSSVHRPGQAARQQVELARRDIATLIGAKPREIVFTSGGTESINLAIRGLIETVPRPVLVTTRVEHAAVRDLAEHLERTGRAEVRWAPVDDEGRVQLEGLRAALDGATLAAIQWANNETGAIQPVMSIGEACRARRVPFVCDGTQWVGKEPVDVAAAAPFDVLVFAPHKFHGPKGVGVLWARRGLGLRPTMHGSQELGRRGGTENVPGIAGAGAASREAAAWLSDPTPRDRVRTLRDLFESIVLAGAPGSVVNGSRSHRLWNTTNIGFPRLEAEALLLMLSERGVCASAGAACSSGSLDPSPVLLAMGVPPEVAHGSLRFSLGRDTTEAEVREAASITLACAAQLRATLPG